MSDLDTLKLLVEDLTRHSYSSLDVLENCNYRYKLQYIDKLRSDKGSLATECGTCLHKCLEIKGRNLIEGKEIDYDYLKDIALNGCTDITDKGSEEILGFNQLKRKYFDDYFAIDPNTGMNYDQKLQLFFDEVLPSRMSEDDDWEIIGVEVHFEFIYRKKYKFVGFIDRVDKNKKTGELRITDYKSSKKTFPDNKIKTPMQHFIYDLACVDMYGQLPVEHVYDFILLNKMQTSKDGVCSKGYINRGIKKLDKILETREKLIEENSWTPKPSPLCYWCSYNSNSPHADPLLKGLCQWHSLWTPDNKTFAVLNPWTGDNAVENGESEVLRLKNGNVITPIKTKDTNNIASRRKLIF